MMEARAPAEILETGSEGGFAHALAQGLDCNPKQIPCKYFYDAEGSILFDAICALPEYYQTRTELMLLNRHAAEIAGLVGPDAEIVEFGAGSAQKIRLLLAALADPHAYLPIDISGAYLRGVAERLAADFPRLRLLPLVGDFTLPLSLPARSGARRIGFFPGGTIGNFRPEAALALLRRMREMLGGGLLVGVDLVKDPALIHAAYHDAAGVTASFNKNLLARANRELDAGFDLDGFAHYAPYNLKAQRIEMYLVSLKRQQARLPCGGTVEFAPGEAIHTEDSHKYSIENFREIAARAGFSPRAVWTDEKRLFSVHWLEPR